MSYGLTDQLSMHREVIELTEFELSLPPENSELGGIPRPIHQAATKQLIGAMKPNEILGVLVQPENFDDLELSFNKFFAVINGGEELNLVFHLHQQTSDVTAALQAYFQYYPNYMQTIGIEDPVDFVDLTKKIGPVSCGKDKSNTAAQEVFPSFSDLCDEINLSAGGCRFPWVSLDYYLIQHAQEYIPVQVGDIECAANSAARALILCDQFFNGWTGRKWGEDGGYHKFADSCPQDIKTYAKATTTPVAVGSLVGGFLLAPLTGGLSFVAGMGIAVATANGAIGAIAKANPTGPSPWELSKFITEQLRSEEFSFSRVYSYENFNDCARCIASSITSSSPVIAFFLWEPFAWHYANVVAVKKNSSGNPEGFMILETGKTFQYRTYNNMQHVMYNQYKFNTSFCIGGTPNNYTVIRFHRK